MTIQEATREWFEMEGWKKIPNPDTSDDFRMPKNVWVSPEGKQEYFMPTIDANYFFDKVVGGKWGKKK